PSPTPLSSDPRDRVLLRTPRPHPLSGAVRSHRAHQTLPVPQKPPHHTRPPAADRDDRSGQGRVLHVHGRGPSTQTLFGLLKPQQADTAGPSKLSAHSTQINTHPGHRAHLAPTKGPSHHHVTQAQRTHRSGGTSSTLDSVKESRITAIVTVAGMLAAMWVFELLDSFVLLGSLDRTFGLRAWNLDSPWTVITAPFMHGNLAHLIGNSLPFL